MPAAKSKKKVQQVSVTRPIPAKTASAPNKRGGSSLKTAAADGSRVNTDSDKKRSGKSSRGEKRPKMVRDSFTLPEHDFSLFKDMKKRCLGRGVEVKKTELLRAALRLLASVNDDKLLDAVDRLERLKTGRPATDA